VYVTGSRIGNTKFIPTLGDGEFQRELSLKTVLPSHCSVRSDMFIAATPHGLPAVWTGIGEKNV
jgi:hypothetical protein